jgi:FkbM family methyltransferase
VATGPAGAALGASLAADTPESVLLSLPVSAVALVDVGASEVTSSHTPYATLVATGRGYVTGFEPDAAALAQLKLNHGDNPHHRYWPHVVGNGQPATFHETNWSPTGSLLQPNRQLLDRYHQLGEHVMEKARHAVPTVRLDDVLAPGGMDLLKIDVQGAERLVFDGAAARLDECLMVWTEVEFVPLYRDQPLFADIDTRLRSHGLQFLCFAGLAQRALASWPLSAPAPQGQQQLWADALYVPTPERISRMPADAAARLALLAHHVARAWDLCHAALLQVDSASGTDFAARYLAASQRQRR